MASGPTAPTAPVFTVVGLAKDAQILVTPTVLYQVPTFQIRSATMSIAPHGHSWAQMPQPLQKS